MRLDHGVGPTTDIDRSEAQGLVHGHEAVGGTYNTGTVAKGLTYCLAEADGDVFSGMMGVDMEIAGAFHRQVKEAMLGPKRQHVIKKTNARRHCAMAPAIEVEGQAYRGFGGRTLDCGGACHTVPLQDVGVFAVALGAM
ncbi:MAG: hypothetical protein NVS2B7_20010 [Herpetosiphon sp.]